MVPANFLVIKMVPANFLCQLPRSRSKVSALESNGPAVMS